MHSSRSRFVDHEFETLFEPMQAIFKSHRAGRTGRPAFRENSLPCSEIGLVGQMARRTP
jgi:hypothetical protein